MQVVLSGNAVHQFSVLRLQFTDFHTVLRAQLRKLLSVNVLQSTDTQQQLEAQAGHSTGVQTHAGHTIAFDIKR